MVSAGRVLIMPKGAWNSTDTYSMLDLVSYNGSSYVAKTSVPANTLPTNTSYWQLSAYGGSSSNVDGNFALTETTDYASRNYTVGDFLVTKDSVFCKVKASITTGDQLVMDTNIEVTSVAALYNAAIDYADELDEKSVKLQGQTAITTQTDLNDLTTVGNYYKSSTAVYVTNAPTGIASELTAIFRLTVENGSDTTDKVVQTLFTDDGKTYKRGYNGSTWSTWAELASAASVSTVRDAVTDVEETIAPVEASTTFAAAYSIGDQFYQGDVLYEAIAPIDIGDTLTVGTNVKVADTVTEQIATVNSDLSNEITTRSAMGAKNLMPNIATSQVINGVTFTVNSDGSVTANGTATDTAIFFVTPKMRYKTGSYKLSGGVKQGAYVFLNENQGDSFVRNVVSMGPDVNVTLDYDDYDNVRCGVVIDTNISVNDTFYPMLRLATDSNTTYEPYALTNQQLTPYALSQSNPNLLDNPWFTVNQRGQSSYSGDGYTVDRWHRPADDASGKTLYIGDSDATTQVTLAQINGDFFQALDADKCPWYNKPYTVSAMIDGVIYKRTFTPINDGQSHYLGAPIGLDNLVWNIIDHWSAHTHLIGINNFGAAQNHTISCIKLEVGEVSTLGMDNPPSYAEELLKCQRYFHKYSTQSFRPSNMYDCIPEMRANPTQSTIVIDGTTYYANSADF